MPRLLALLAGSLCVLVPSAARAQDPVLSQTPPPLIREVRITGNKELPELKIREAMRVRVGDAWSHSAAQIAETVEGAYREQGYAFAKATATFDAAAGVVAVSIDEGVIDEVEFEGIEAKLARAFKADFALRAGDVFNRPRARQALDALLRQTRGAVRRDLRGGRAGAFDLIDRNGRRVLVVSLQEPAGRFKITPDLGEREDWFTPVDGFVPSLGFGAAVFDHEQFNHAYVAGHFSVKFGSGHVGYALGFERPVFGAPKLFLGGELHDLTASDDQWQISSTEASLAAMGPRRSYRDYYRRRGVQVSGALRAQPHVELLFAWRGERQTSLETESDFSVWNSDEPFRPNLSAQAGRLNAIVLGASVDGRGFDRESLDATYRRHQLDTPFGGRLPDPEGQRDESPIWRVDWTSEISGAGALGSDFDFRRHILSGRARLRLSPHQDVGVRAIGGWSDGVLPPQRQFAIGGIGSLHGYAFKEAAGDSLQLLNLEYALGWRDGLQLLGFFDAGHVDRRDAPAAAPWLKGVGWGIGVGDMRIDFGYRLDAVPSSLQVLLRFGRTF